MVGYQIRVEGTETLCYSHRVIYSHQIYLDRDMAECKIPDCIAQCLEQDLLAPYEQNVAIEPKGSLVVLEIIE